MQRLRLVLLLGLVVALGGAVVANGQDGTSVFNDSDQKSDAKQGKTKAKDNSGHRKHWYSLPHWFHRKHGKDSTTSKSKANRFDKPSATNHKVASTESKTVATGTNQKSSISNTKTVAGAKPAGKAVATTNSGAKTGGTAGKKTVAAVAKDNSGHHKHWYSLPDWFHRKHDKDSTAKTVASAKSTGKAVATTHSGAKTGGTGGTKTVAAVAKDSSGHRKHWYSLPDWFHSEHDKDSNTKTVASAKSTGKAVATTHSGAKTGGTASTKPVPATHRGTKTATGTEQRRKTVAGASQGKKAARHDCTPELAKKGGCTVDKTHSQKESTNPS